VSSTYHIRRGLILLTAVADRHNLAIRFDHMAATDPLLSTPRIGVSEAERDLIAEDLARATTLPLVEAVRAEPLADRSFA
jgi:hypothetical protein